MNHVPMKTLVSSAVFVCALGTVGCDSDDDPVSAVPGADASMGGEEDAGDADAGPDAEAAGDGAADVGPSIVDLAVASAELSTLVSALQAAELVDTLVGVGPFTVLAPTNAAFDALPAGQLDALLADQEALRRVLLHHVVAGGVTASDLEGVVSVQSLAGATLLVDAGEEVRFNQASVIQADLEARNGVVHLIDSVLLPPSDNVVEAAAANPELSTLVAAVTAAGLVDALSAQGPFTVFAPTNAAFDALPEGTLDALLNDVDALTDVLLHHVVDGQVLSGNLSSFPTAPTLLEGQELTINLSNGVRIDDANVVSADVLVTNGVVHVVDSVLLPE